jgi:hypothetical protein
MRWTVDRGAGGVDLFVRAVAVRGIWRSINAGLRTGLEYKRVGSEQEGRYPMGDKGGKKDKAKGEKQKSIKNDQDAKRKLEKQPKRKP